MNLNLGCGTDIKKGFVNVDLQKPADVIHDLETFPYPFEDNSVDYIYCRHVLEHLFVSPVKVMDELIRIAKDGCIIDIIVPFYNSASAGDFAHARGGFDFKGFAPREKREYYYKNGNIELLERTSRAPKRTLRQYIPFREKLSHTFGNLTVALTFKYKVIK